MDAVNDSCPYCQVKEDVSWHECPFHVKANFHPSCLCCQSCTRKCIEAMAKAEKAIGNTGE